ncbi:MAG: NADH-quinone oxidoreductase subunit M [Phycisphaerae bacterium]
MILIWLIVIPVAAGVLGWFLGRWSTLLTRWTCLLALILDLVLVLAIWWYRNDGQGTWLVQTRHLWIPQLGISFYLAMDGLSLLLVMLTAFLGIMSVACSWSGIREQVGFFHMNLMWILAGIMGVFLALDLFLFYFFWELMLVPMYFLIAIWGHENRAYAAIKFFLFTQLSGLLMLAAILGLYFIHGRNTGTYTFDYTQLLGTSLSPAAAMWLMLGFFIAFAVKIPTVGVHSWLPDAHTEAPTAGSVILAGLLLKTGAYGLIRFVIPLFPDAARDFTPVAMILGVVGILYGAIMAFAQTDLKRLVAYTSISHMGFVLIGVFAWNMLALQGAVIVILAHGVTTGALFILVGDLQDRIHTRDMTRMGGLWSTVPRISGIALFLALASLGLPGLGNFVGEFLVLLGTYPVNILITALASTGFIFSVIYALYMIQNTFHGPQKEVWSIPDISPREATIMGLLIVVIVWLGLYPNPFFKTVGPALNALLGLGGKL